MKKLLSISYTLIVVFLIGMAHVDNASGQEVENTWKRSANSIVARRGSGSNLVERLYTDASIFDFTSTELRQISGRYASEGSNIYSQALREYWDKLNARIESQRTKFSIR